MTDADPTAETLLTRAAREVRAAAHRIRDHVPVTPVTPAPQLSRALGREVLLKLENRQISGSFKFRGVTNALLAMAPADRDRGVVAASSGNHGLALAHAAKRFAVPATIFVPETATAAKVAALRDGGGEGVVYGDDCVDTEARARDDARRSGRAYISPYNDWRVVGGQGTIAVELMAQLDVAPAMILASVGGGGLISGIGAWVRDIWPETRVVGCSPAASAVMMASVRAGRIVDLPSLPTLSDGTAGGVEADAITFDLVRAVVDEWVAVEEDAIADAMAHVQQAHDMGIEGAAGVAVAALNQVTVVGDGPVVVVICGGNGR